MIFILLPIIIIWATFAVVNFIATLSATQKNVTLSDMQSIAESNATEVKYTFERFMSTIKAVAKSVELHDDFKSPAVIALLDNIVKDDLFVRLAVDFADGTSYTSDGHMIDISALNYGDKIKIGNPFMLDVTSAIIDGTPVTSIIVPIKNAKGKYTAALRGSIPTEVLTLVFNRTFVNSGGYYHIIDGEGKYISDGNLGDSLMMDENFFDAVFKLKFDKNFSAQKIKDDFENNVSGFSQYSYKNQYMYAYYSPVGINDWTVLMIIPKDVVEQTTTSHLINAFWLCAQIILIILIFTFYIYKSQSTARKVAMLSEKCFKELAKQTKKVIFEWDFANNRISTLSNFQDLFGREPLTQNSPNEAIDANAVHPDDKYIFSDIFSTIVSGNSVKDAEFRVRDADNEYHWCTISGVVINDDRGTPYKAVGSLENIDVRVKKEELLRHKAEIDQLTGLYNKTTTECMIELVLSGLNVGSGKHALYLIDIDNFKSINDVLGHFQGDLALSQLAGILRQIFRADDIVGRIGGDEFFVFIKNYSSLALITNKAQEICKSFCITYSAGEKEVRLSASVGVAICPENGKTLQELYKCADKALYSVKSKSKNNYEICATDDSVPQENL